jgi:hypothetical protein
MFGLLALCTILQPRGHEAGETTQPDHLLLLLPVLLVLLQVGVAGPPDMDDTVAMQDTNGPTTLPVLVALNKADGNGCPQQQPDQHTAAGGAEGSRQLDCSPCAPQSPSMLTQQVRGAPPRVCGNPVWMSVVTGSALHPPLLDHATCAPPAAFLSQVVQFDTSSVASDGSGDHGSGKQHGPPRRTYSNVDVDAAKQAAMSALAGLDMTTTKANLDASKAAAATARANGEVPTHVRKSNLRSVSCRQLGTTSSSAAAPGGVGKSVAFDEASKQRPADGAARTVQWRAGTTSMQAADGSVPRRPTRAPASRCISLPHVLQGRAGMANRLAATYAQEAALQQQLQLLNGGTQAGHPFANAAQLQAGVPAMDVLSMYQLQQQAAAAGGQLNAPLMSQRSFGANTVATMDDSMLQLRSNNMLLAAQQQQQQAARIAGNWPNAAAAGQQRVTWATGTAPQVQQQAALAANQQQLLMQLQGGTQAVPAGGPGSNEAVWLQNPAAASAALMTANRPQNLLLANQAGGAGGIPGMPASSALLSPHLQQPAGGPGLAGNPQASAMVAAFTQLLEQYQNVSWQVLAASQADANTREQLLTEVVLQLTLLHTLSGVLKSTLAPADALNDFSYLGSAARRHIANFSRLSQAGDLAVQLLAMVAPLACRHLTGTGEKVGGGADLAWFLMWQSCHCRRSVHAFLSCDRTRTVLLDHTAP